MMMPELFRNHLRFELVENHWKHEYHILRLKVHILRLKVCFYDDARIV